MIRNHKLFRLILQFVHAFVPQIYAITKFLFVLFCIYLYCMYFKHIIFNVFYYLGNSVIPTK